MLGREVHTNFCAVLVWEMQEPQKKMASVKKCSDYYPFGLTMPGRSTNTANPNDNYKFTGYENDDEGELDLYHANARGYDPVLGRFMQVDPLLHLYAGWSPYHYAANNPLRVTDPSGKSWLVFNSANNTVSLYTKEGKLVGTWEAYNNLARGKIEWAGGSYNYSHQNKKKYSGASDSDRIDSRGIMVFKYPDEDGDVPGSSGRGIHAGRQGQTDGYGNMGAAFCTYGCIRTTPEAMDAINKLHETDRVQSIVVTDGENEEDTDENNDKGNSSSIDLIYQLFIAAPDNTKTIYTFEDE